MVAKVSEQEWIDRITKAGEGRYRFVRWDGAFKGARSKSMCRCEIDGYEWSTTVSSLVNVGTGCPQCSGKRVWTADERIDQINAKPNITFVRWDGEYKGNHSNAICRCDVDGYEWSTGINDFINAGRGCPQCAGNRKLTADERIDQINAKPNITFVRWDGEYKGNRSKAICRCEIDGHEWATSISCLVHAGSGCPRCSVKLKRTGEQEGIDQINAKPNIRFVRWDGEFKGMKSRCVCHCEIDGYEWSVGVRHLVSYGTGCPYCTRYGKTEEQPAPNVTIEIPTDVKPAFDLLNW